MWEDESRAARMQRHSRWTGGWRRRGGKGERLGK